MMFSAFSNLKFYCFTDGSEMRFFWSFIFESKPAITAPCVIFWFKEEDSFGPILLDCSFKYSKTTFQLFLLSNNVCKTTFKSIPTLLFSKIWTRYGQVSCYGCFEDKSENFTIHCTIHRLLFTAIVHSEFLPI